MRESGVPKRSNSVCQTSLPCKPLSINRLPKLRNPPACDNCKSLTTSSTVIPDRRTHLNQFAASGLPETPNGGKPDQNGLIFILGLERLFAKERVSRDEWLESGELSCARSKTAVSYGGQGQLRAVVFKGARDRTPPDPDTVRA